MYDIQKIMKCLPHRYPFLLVDRVLEIDEQHAVGIKNVTINEPFFQGHFPAEPVMPGVLVLEAMKMENEIFAPADGVVKEIRARDGDTVNTGDVMMVIG